MDLRPPESEVFSGGGGGGGGGGAGGSDAGGFRALLLGIAVIAILISYIHHVWKLKHDAIATIGRAKMQVSVRCADIESPGVLKFAHGQLQTVDMSVHIDYTIYYSRRAVRLELLHDGAVLYSQVWEHSDMASIFPLGAEIRRVFPVGDYVVRASVEGAPSAHYAFTVRPRPPGIIHISDTPPQWPRKDITTLQMRPGESKRIFAYIRISGTMPPEGRTVYISLDHEGATLFNYSNHVTERNRDFYVPYEADFSEGLYTAKLSADGEPPAEYTFKVQYPIVESAEDKNRRIKQFMDAILPLSPQSSSAVSTVTNTERSQPVPATVLPAPNQVKIRFQDCYTGTWYEDESKESIWYFQRMGNNLGIRRNDESVSGHFRKSADGWTGFLDNRSNRVRLTGVVLHDANATCDEITTNQSWSYKR